MNRLYPNSLVIVAAMALLGTEATAQTFENDSGGSVRFYGQFSPTWLSYDDGEETTSTLADNANSNSRLGFVITQPYGDNTLKLTFETALGFVQTSEVMNGDVPDWIDWQRTDLRKFEAAWKGQYGTITFGQGSMATDGAATLDASGTGIAGTVTVDDVAGGFAFRNGDGVLSDVTVGDAFNDLDGGRRFRLRYDTPDYSGFSLAFAYGQNILAEDDDTDYYDAALRWSGETGDFDLSAAAGYAWADPDDGDTQEQFSASATLLHRPTGLNLALSGGTDPDGGSYGYIKAGWIGDIFTVGSTALSIDYYDGQDFVTDGSSSQAFGVSAVQTFKDLDLEVYAGWRSYEYADDAATYQDAESVLLGARWRF